MSNLNSPSSFSIPIAASPSVGYDVQEVIVDRNKSLPPVPKIGPVPRPRGEVKGKVGITEKRLPAVPNSVRKKGLPPPPVEPPAPKGGFISTTAPEGASRAQTQSQPKPKMKRFMALDDRVSERPRKKAKESSSLGRMARAFSSSLVPTLSTEGLVTDKHAARKQELKAKISQPLPIGVPKGANGFSANFASEYGGVGGAAAAVAMLPGGRKPDQVKVGKGKQRRYTPPPPAQAMLRPERSNREEKPSNKGAVNERPSWRNLLTSPLVGPSAGKSFPNDPREREKAWTRKRLDSDTSFACQGIENYPQHSQEYEIQKARAPPTGIQDPGPSNQSRGRLRQRYDFDDRTLVPEPLRVGNKNTMNGTREGDARTCTASSGIRDTRFYQPYNEVLHEYGETDDLNSKHVRWI